MYLFAVPRRSLSPAIVPELVAVTAIAVLYVATATHFVLGGDNAEFVTLAADGGVAHPPGYPLYVLYLRALHAIPATTPAHAAALATAFLGIGAAWSLLRACRAWGASSWAAASAASIYALSTLAWRLGTQAEVFTLHALLAALILLIAAPKGPFEGARRASALAFLAGLGLSNHHSIVLLAPVGLWAAVDGVRAAKRPWLAAAAALGSLVLGLLPYAYLAASARSLGAHFGWGEAETASGLLRHFLRADYGTTRLGATDAAPQPFVQIVNLTAGLARQLLVVPAAAAAVGAVVALRAGAPRRAGAVAHAASFVLAGPLFATRFNVEPEGVARLVVERFYLLPLLVTSVFVALGLDAAFRLAPTRTRFPPLVLAASLSIATAVSLPDVVVEHRPALDWYLQDTLAIADTNAIVLGTGDHRYFGFPYVQRALGARRDVTYIDPNLLRNPWYLRRIEAVVGAQLPVLRGMSVDTRDLLTRLLATGRPVFVTDLFAAPIRRDFKTYDIGTLIRVLDAKASVPDRQRLLSMNEAAFATLRDAGPAAPDTWPALVRPTYARPWRSLADDFAAHDEMESAARCRERAATFE